MNIKFNSSVLFVTSIEKSKQFYSETLGQEVLHNFGACIILKCGISLWQITDNHVIAQKSDVSKVNTRISGKFELCFETDTINDVFDKVKNSGITFLHPIHEEPWGQFTFRFFDPDGHLIEVGEFLETFVKRIYAENHSVEATSAKTGVNIETVKEMIL